MKLYHTSPTKNRNSILKFGLIPQELKKTFLGQTISYEPRIFLTIIPKDASTLDFINQYEDVDFWEVDIDERLLKEDNFSHIKGKHFFVETPIKEVKLFHHIPTYNYSPEQLLRYKNFLEN